MEAENMNNENIDSNQNFNEIIYNIIRSALKDTNLFTTDSQSSRDFLTKCKTLYGRDYHFATVDNSNGRLCSSYPVELIVPIEQKNNDCIEEQHNGHNGGNSGGVSFVEKDYLELLNDGRMARTRNRFPVPVFLVFGKHICRSSTLARSAEIYGRCTFNYIYPLNLNARAAADTDGKNEADPSVQYRADETESKIDLPAENGNDATPSKGDTWMIDKMRKMDIDILKFLNVHVICDLMVEKKKVKYGMHVTSSEKVDSLRRYDQFQLVSVPYPGCEFFADYSNNNYDGNGLRFDWNQQFIDADLQIPENIMKKFDFDWENYCSWDLIKLTQNYVKLMLSCIKSPDSNGFLVHCISGWDRTPLFVSILRISLWADNLIHQSLSPEEMLYLTLVYDWLLFSHQFADRIRKSEEILHFCFEFLLHISGEEFSLAPEEDEEDGGDDSEPKTPIGCDSTSDSEQMFQLDSFSDMKLDNCSSNHSSDCNLNVPVDFTSQRKKLYSSSPVSAKKDNIDAESSSIENGHALESMPSADSNFDGRCNSDNDCETIKHNNHNNSSAINMSATYTSSLIDLRGPKSDHDDSSAIMPIGSASISSGGFCTELNEEAYKRSNNNDVKIVTARAIPKVLSSSFEIQRKVCNNNGSSPNGLYAPPCSRLASALSIDTISKVANPGRSSSDPILVPGKRIHHKALSAECLGGDDHKHHFSGSGVKDLLDGSSCGSASYHGNLVEPGSSWQMISSPPKNTIIGLPSFTNSDLSPPSPVAGLTCDLTNSSRHRVRKDSSLVSSEPSLLNGDCSSYQYDSAPQPAASGNNGKLSNGGGRHRRLQLERRKQRLEEVRKLAIPAYLRAVQDERADQNAHGSLLSYFTTLVKRS